MGRGEERRAKREVERPCKGVLRTEESELCHLVNPMFISALY